MKCENARPMSSLGTPLISSTFYPSSPQTFTRPTLARLVSAPSPEVPPSSQYHDSSSDSSHSTTSGPPLSPNTEDFHFPILSADGHLLPPPITSRRSWIDASQIPSDRPLPSPPLAQPEVLSPIPKTSKRWAYQPQDGLLSPEAIVGLYDGFDRDVGTGSINSSSRIITVEKQSSPHRPHTATLHRTFSAEGEEILLENSRRY
jgi:hypothetical protein